MHTTKRLYSIAASPPLKSSSAVRAAAIPTSPRPRRASLSLSLSNPSSSSSSSLTSTSSSSVAVTSPPPPTTVTPSSTRSLYTNAQGPLHYFDSGAPPPPPPPPLTSRSGNPHLVSTSRLTTGEAQAQAQTHSQSSQNQGSSNTAQTPQDPSSHSHSPHSHSPSSQSQSQQTSQQTTQHHGQTSNGGQQQAEGSQPLLGSTSLPFSLGAPTSPPAAGSNPSDRGSLLHVLNSTHSGIGAAQLHRTTATGEVGETRAREEEGGAKGGVGKGRIFQLDVGAYGIPKRGRGARTYGFQRERERMMCACSECIAASTGSTATTGGGKTTTAMATATSGGGESYSLESLENAVQVGEDAYFVREDALGVADGVGGWGSGSGMPMVYSSSPHSHSHSCLSCASASTSSTSTSSSTSAASRVTGLHRHPHHHYHHHHHRRSGAGTGTGTPHTHTHTHMRTVPVLSPSALFASRLMHYCAREVGEERARVDGQQQQLQQQLQQQKQKQDNGRDNADNHLDLGATSTSTTTTASSKPTLKYGNLPPRIPPSPLPFSMRPGGGGDYTYPHPQPQPQPQTRMKTKIGNARPFAWPWEESGYGEGAMKSEDVAYSSIQSSLELGLGVEERAEMTGEDRMRAALGTPAASVESTAATVGGDKGVIASTTSSTNNNNVNVNNNSNVNASAPAAASGVTTAPAAASGVTTAAAAAVDPLAGTIDPVDVLERAYNCAIDSHRVRRRVRVVRPKTKSKSSRTSRWWPYNFGLKSGSGSLAPVSESSELDHNHDRSGSINGGNGGIGSGADEDSEFIEEWEDRWEPLLAGSSTALLAVLSGDRLRVAHLGDCVGWLVREGEVVWRSEEMWWGFNCPLQLGPASSTVPGDARRYDLEVKADDILILASDGMSDNLWEEDVLDEVRRAVAAHMPFASSSTSAVSASAATPSINAKTNHNIDGSNNYNSSNKGEGGVGATGTGTGMLGRRTLAGMLSEALCSRARRVSEEVRGGGGGSGGHHQDAAKTGSNNNNKDVAQIADDDLPFARRAKEEGRKFRGGKCDDISVLVAVISPVATQAPTATPASASTSAPAPATTMTSTDPGLAFGPERMTKAGSSPIPISISIPVPIPIPSAKEN